MSEDNVVELKKPDAFVNNPVTEIVRNGARHHLGQKKEANRLLTFLRWFDMKRCTMSRPLRIEYPDAWYHVMNRGRRSESVFSYKEDYWQFTELLKETSEMWNIREKDKG